MRIFYFSVTQNQTQISSETRRILKIAILKLSKEMLKYVSDKQLYSVIVAIQHPRNLGLHSTGRGFDCYISFHLYTNLHMDNIYVWLAGACR